MNLPKTRYDSYRQHWRILKFQIWCHLRMHKLILIIAKYALLS